MKLIDKISLSYGLKPKSPFIYKSYINTPQQDYIIIENNSSPFNEKYIDFDEVSAITFSYLSKQNIIPLQLKINPKDNPIFRCHQHQGISFSQANHLIEFSKLVITNNPYTAHVANALEIPNIFLCKSGLKELNCPDHTNSTTTLELNDSCSPELISSKIFKILNIDSIINKINVLRCGKNYRNKSIICVPDFEVERSGVLNQNIIIRADLHFNETNIFNLIANNKSIIITDRVLNKKGLSHPDIIKNILEMRVEINKDTPSELVKELQDLNIIIKLFTKDKNHLNNIRLKYIDYEVEFEDTEKNLDILNEICNNTVYYKSSKVIVSNNKQYSSVSNWKAGKEINPSSFEEITKEIGFAEELEDLKLFKLND